MRFAIKTRPEHTTWAELRDVWIAADDIDLFESAWNWDHFYPLTPPLTGPNFEGWTMIAALGQATKRIRVGCQVTGMIYRHPAVLANMAATVDHITNGRLELGLGAGWNQQECDAYGISLPPLRERFDRFDEGVESIVKLLTQTTTTVAGKYIQLTDARSEPKPVQQPHPPITIGGKGPRRTLRAVARWAQQWNVIIGSPGEWLELKETLVAHCADLGRNPAEITCSVNIKINEDLDPDKATTLAAESAAQFREAGVNLAVMNLPHRAAPTILEPLATALQSLAD
jgi:F420-dependent oxidoreductase-like protein